jgi:Zn-dependent M28 family amino/carboxypeptidase
VPNAALLNAWNRRATTGRDLNPSVGWAYSQFPLPRVLLSRDAAQRLLAGSAVSADAVFAAEQSRTFPASADLGSSKRVSINFAATTTDDRPYNVVGFLEGSDTTVRNEWISLAAHLDGAVGRGVREGDSIYNAADDNGSGSAGNMAIVRALVQGPRPRRSILVIWDSGEEVGLWGTRHIAYGTWSDRIVAHVSNDMIGRTKAPGTNNPREENLAGPGEVYVTGPAVLSTNMEAILQRSLTQFPYARANRVYETEASEFFYPRTDAGPYLERGIPILQFFTGLHADYHLQSDEVAKLDPAKMEAVSRQSYVTTWMLADSPTKPLWDGPVPSTLWWVTPRR